jgi:hypothetical protein
MVSTDCAVQKISDKIKLLHTMPNFNSMKYIFGNFKACVLLQWAASIPGQFMWDL